MNGQKASKEVIHEKMPLYFQSHLFYNIFNYTTGCNGQNSQMEPWDILVKKDSGKAL